MRLPAGPQPRAHVAGPKLHFGPQAVHVRIGPGTPLAPEAVAQIPRRFEGASFTPQGVVRIPVLSAARPLALLAEILSALEAL